MKKVLTTMPLTEKHQDAFEDISANLSFTFSTPSEVTPKMVKDADLIVGNVPPAYLKGHKHLLLLQLNSAGTDGYCVPGLLSEETHLCNATGAYGLAISEHMLASLLMLIKKLDKYYVNQKAHQWKDEGNVRSIEGSTTLVIGAGDIGSSFGKKMHALGSTVIGIRRHKTEPEPYMKSVHTMEELDTLLKKADFVACSLPGTKETFHLFDAARLKKMKRTAILINVGRGALIDPDVLAAALADHTIGGACLDVTETEPLPKESPLWDAPNLILTPHVSGQYHLNETRERIVRIALHNVKAVLEGTEVINEVDRESGYRAFKG